MRASGWTLISLLVLLGAARLAQADETLAPAQSEGELVAGLLVVSASGVSYEDGVLSLLGAGATTIIIADHPDRALGHMPTRDAVRVWSQGPSAFDSNPPFATLSMFQPDGSVSEVVLELNHPKLVGDTLTFDARVVRGPAPITGGASTLFIGATDMPLSTLPETSVPPYTAPDARFYTR